MCARHQPESGVDSALYHAYRVRLQEELGARWWVSVPQAMGPNDARNQAIEKAKERGFMDVTALQIERAS